MPLFDVPGWSVPGKPFSTKKNKKKTASQAESNNEPDTASNLKRKTLDDDGHESEQRPSKKAKVQLQEHEHKPESNKKKATISRPMPLVASSIKSRDRQKRKKASEIFVESDIKAASSSTLTPLQQKLKHSLDGARFRFINESLYKSDSRTAHKTMQDNPVMFDEYHTGFRHQVQSWPENPVEIYISLLSKYPPKTVIADLGCGDAAIARELVPKGYNVLSYDLVSSDGFVIEADICSKLPLPGSEDEDGNTDDGGQIVDVAVCALSLMGTNWPTCIREAWRVLRIGGALKIAEVKSRIPNISAFITLIKSIGFHMKEMDDKNSHFILFAFEKVARSPKSAKEWKEVLSKGSILQPCEYKRR